MPSMLVLCACVCLVALVPLSEGYASGPPVNTIANLCRDMDPNVVGGHGAAQQTVASPFEVVTSQTCYRPGQMVQVVVRNPAGSEKIEGLFVQARQVGTTVTSGTFSVTDSVLSTLTCTNTALNSAVGHNKEKKSYYRSMQWMPPAGARAQFKFRATVVKGQSTFWVGLESPALNYDANCVAGAEITNTRGGGTTLQAAPYCLTLAMVSFIMAIFTQ